MVCDKFVSNGWSIIFNIRLISVPLPKAAPIACAPPPGALCWIKRILENEI